MTSPPDRQQKRQTLRRHGTLNPQPESVAHPLFQNSDFFDPDDLLQVKYEKRSGSDLRELYTGSVELTDEPSSTVRLKVTGREQGQKPLFKGRTSVLIKVPNEYSLE